MIKKTDLQPGTAAIDEGTTAETTTGIGEVAESKSVNVTMKSPAADGTPRIVTFGQRGKLKKEVTFTTGVDEATGLATKVGTLSIDCVNGDTHTLVIVLVNPEAQEKLLLELALHGAFQKVSDSITKAELPDDVSLGVKRQLELIKAGEWSVRNTDTTNGLSDLIEAVRRARNYEVGSDPHKALIEGLPRRDPDYIKLLKNSDQIKAFLAQITMERAAAKASKLMANLPPVSEDALLDGL